MKYVSILSLMAAFTAFSTDASAVIKLEMTGKDCDKKACIQTIEDAVEMRRGDCKIINISDLTITDECNKNNHFVSQIIHSGQCPNCDLKIVH